MRALLGQRAQVGRPHTATVLRGPHRMARQTGARCSVKRLHALPPQALQSLLSAESQGLAVTSRLAVWAGRTHQITTREQTVQTRLHHTPSDEPWLPGAGIGPLWAPTLAWATGARSRLPQVGPSAASGRGVERNPRSHGQRQGPGHGNHGHPAWAWASREAAPWARRFQPAAPRFSQRPLAKSRNHTVLARKAVAQQWARAGDDMRRDLVPCEATQALG